MKKLILSLAKMLVLILGTTIVTNAQVADAQFAWAENSVNRHYEVTMLQPSSCFSNCSLGCCEVTCTGPGATCTCTSGGVPSCTCASGTTPVSGSFKRHLHPEQATNVASLIALAESFRTAAGDNYASHLNTLSGVGLTDYTGYNSWVATNNTLFSALSGSEQSAVNSFVASHPYSH